MKQTSLMVALVLSLMACDTDSSTGDPTQDTASSGTDTATGTDSTANADTTTGSDTAARDAPGADTTTPPLDTTQPGGTLAERYPADQGMSGAPSVLFHDDFEGGWGQWDAPSSDTAHLTMETNASIANAGTGYLRSTVTTQDLQSEQYISSASRVSFDRVEEVYWRFYARFPEVAPNPHHWVRVAAGNETWNGSGLANTVPAGGEGFWFDFDINNDDVFNFYAYWYNMRSGRCNDGSVTPGCAGDQGTTYYYGNVFRPPNQNPYPRDAWFCIEMRAKANTVGSMDGELSFWIDDALVGDYRPGYPDGTWLRAQFHTDGCTFSACTEPVAFEGLDLRASAEVGFKSVILDAYYERDSSANKRQKLEDRGLTVSDNQTILYDDIVVATERIGCKR